MPSTRLEHDEANAAYTNKTLVYNWWEDRHMTADTKGLTTSRVFATDVGGFPPPPYELATTKREFDHSRLTSPPPAVVSKPSLYSSKNLVDRLVTYGQPESLTYTMGRTVPQQEAEEPDRHLKTTNMVFYEEKPQASSGGVLGGMGGHWGTDSSRPPTNMAFYEEKPQIATATMPPEYFAPSARTHFKDNIVYKDSYDKTHLGSAEGEPKGSKGDRGEITRNPREAGNPYGISVFVDEYAKWQTKLNGMPLTESIRRAKTKYF